MNTQTFYFDMDGTIVDFYGVDRWLTYLNNYDPHPYIVARPLVNMSMLARRIHKMQALGYRVAIISWLSKTSTPNFDEAVIEAKRAWLAKHLPSVQWDEIHIVSYGTPKSTCASQIGILFDDEERNRNEWKGEAFEPSEIFKILTR